MCGHVVGTFVGVAVEPIVLGRDAAEEIIEIANDIGIGVLLDRQRRRSVLDEERQKTRGNVLLAQPECDFTCKVVQTLAVGANADGMGVLPQTALLDRHTLRQIPRLIHVAAAPYRDVIRQQLQRHDLQNRQQ